MFQRLIFFVLIPLILLSQQHKVRVFDAWDLKPLYESLVITSEDTVYTDEDGYAVFNSADSVLMVEKDQYYSVRLDFIPERNFSVYLQPVVSSLPIFVTAQRTSLSPLMLPASATHIDLASDKYKAATLPGLLNQQSGLFIKSYGGSGQIQFLAMRGMTAEQTQIFFDGIPLNSLQLGSVDLSQINMDQTGSIAIYRGGGAHFGGSGSIGGSINIRPQTIPDSFSVNLKQSYSTLENALTALDFNFRLLDLKQQFAASLSNARNNYSTKDDGRQVPLQNRDYKSRNLQWQGVYNLLNNLKLKALVNNYYYNGGAALPFSGAAAEKNNRAEKKYDNTLARLRAEHLLNSGSVVYQGYVRNEWNNYYDPNLNQKSVHFNQEKGAQMHLQQAFLKNYMINGGLEIVGQKIKSTDSGDHERQRFALFLLSKNKVWQSPDLPAELEINGSVRFEKIAQTDLLLPGGGFTFTIKNLSLYGSIGRNHRVPTFNELYWPLWGNRDLVPEKSINYEAGISYKKNLSVFITEVRTAFFYSKISDQIKWLPEGNQWRPRNIAEVVSKGYEFSTRLASEDGRHEINFNYSYTDTRKNKKEFPGDNTVGNRIPFIPAHKINISAQGTLAFLHGGLGFENMSFRYQSLSNSPLSVLDAHNVWSAWLAYTQRFNNRFKMTFSLNVENLTDQSYQIISGYPMPLRVYEFSLKLNY